MTGPRPGPAAAPALVLAILLAAPFAAHAQGAACAPGPSGGASPSAAESLRDCAATLFTRLTPAAFLPPGQTGAQLASGTIDARPALAAMLAQGAGFLPCGTYTLGGTLAVTHGLEGAGKDCVVIRSGVASGDMLLVPAGTADVQISRLTLRRTAPQADGAGIHVAGARGTVVRDIETAGTPAPFHDIILLDAASNTTFIEAVNLAGASGACIHMAGQGPSQLVLETHIRDGVLAGCGDGLLVEHGSGLYLDNVDALANRGAGFRFAVGGAQYFYGATLKGDLADSNTGPGFDFTCGVAAEAGCGPINHVTLSGDWWSGGAGLSTLEPRPPGSQLPSPGLRAANPRLDGLILEGGTVRANGGHGIELDQGANINIVNLQAFNNNWPDFGAPYAGLFVNWPVRDVTVVGCRIGGGGVDRTPLQGNAANHQRYGIVRAQPPAHAPNVNLVVTGCNVTGNVTAGSSIGSVPGDAIVWSANIPATPNR